MHVANRAKTVGGRTDYFVANVAFAMLLDTVFVSRMNAARPVDGDVAMESRDQGSMFTFGKVDRLMVSLETSDGEGTDPNEVFYDLLVITAIGPDDAVIDSLCIPAPLVRWDSLVTALKQAEVVERGEHNRSHVDEPGELVALWAELLGEFKQELMLDIADKHLAEEKPSDDPVEAEAVG